MISRFNDARDRFFDMRFGLFIHWGLYAIPAWHEQILWRGNVKRNDYEKLIHEFNPIEFDPEAWLDLAQEAGMQYLCFTTKHHDGFCMWDTSHTDYKITHTPYGKDVLAMLAEACRKRNFPLSLYYSCPDWHHPNYPNMGRHHEMFGPRPGDEPDINQYYEYVTKQLRELLTNYGPIYQLFWDVNVAEYHNPSLNELVRSLQPGILINNRGPDEGDYSTPERHVPKGGSFLTPTEACQSIGRESWGYRENEDYYSDKFLMQSVDKILAMGGNYLLNVGPMPDGTITSENANTLRRIGRWYKKIRESFEGTISASYMGGKDEIESANEVKNRVFRDHVLLTRKGNTVYVHAYRDLQSNTVILKPLDVLPKRAILLNNGQELESSVELLPWYWQERAYLRICNLPINEITDEVLVIKLEFGEDVTE
ncbi:alpha-L-fucosidase [Paenibacillus sp. FSL H7-0331]|uniref:alpha-L-fucosidase n=1 Tax=Paenibacillus sp. FSL H7-0331 TaxID=1920421 RepID=UPI00096DD455|nr:alpha-L-fucosidase [Paenibacillus sp. FSL H7-0331]OMF19548.1 glycoside hydrolase [Paenibacillus sp. FSL H7-0331]